MKRIPSFCVDHTKLQPGIYTSRIDDDIVTYDIRMKKPNVPPFLPTASMHTIEHLFATISRNSEYEHKIIYFGPMGCRTGFYFLVRDMKPEDAIALIQRCKKSSKRIPSLYCKLDSGTAKIRIIYKQSSHNFLIVRKKGCKFVIFIVVYTEKDYTNVTI